MGAHRLLRSRLALTTVLSVAPFIGYGREVHAACDPLPSPTFICSDTTNTTQTIIVDDANVSTAASPPFVLTTAGSGLQIWGNGHLQFTDENASTIDVGGVGLDVQSYGNSAANDGAI